MSPAPYEPTYLCQSAQDIANVIGAELAVKLISNRLKWTRVGRRARVANIYFPKRLKADHWLIEQVGREAAEKLVDSLGGETFKVSSSPWRQIRQRDNAIRQQAAEGASDNALARAFELSDRHIRNITRGVFRDRPGNDNAAND